MPAGSLSEGPSTSTSSSTLIDTLSSEGLTEISPLLPKRTSTNSINRTSVSEDGDKGQEVEIYEPGKSTFSQTLLNTLADIIGTGLLACPIAVAHAGWILGPFFLVIIGLLTLWTLKIMLRIIEKDRRMRNFSDVIGYGLGPTAERWVVAFFASECVVWCVALVVLFSDSLNAVWPILTSDQWKVVGLAVIIPTSFLPLRYLAFSSAVGITSTWTLVGILIFSGITTPHAPGAIREPAHTDLFPSHGLVKLGTVFGLLISGFGGHELIPNLVRDMAEPKKADKVMHISYAISMIVYIVVAVFGYLMYGTNVSDEVTKDLAQTPGFSPILNKLAVLTVALNPLTKLPLGLRPLNDLVFSYFKFHPTVLVNNGTDTPQSDTETTSPSNVFPQILDNKSDAEIRHTRRERLKSVIRPLIRVFLAVGIVIGALIMPSFENVLSLLGSGFATVMAVLLPIWAGAKVFGWKWYQILICVIVSIVALIGMGCGFFMAIERER